MLERGEERKERGIGRSGQAACRVEAGGFWKVARVFSKHDSILEFFLLYVKIKVSLGVYVKHIRTCLLF
jgi:hypothetical protein